ncbi:uncharacterized protein LOC132637168 [Lycium barbarum]|uniref:uncharacterized protein LOC132637168 n=1 Tax=Lycium barbarum TaxID=112863 RepID=UPI00293F0A26|nr:uncharacterized protein LOC132637168 [Lycium barbarum]
MNKKASQINHLAYADDIVIFCGGKTRSIKAVIKVIQRYEKSSGLKVNGDKSFFVIAPKTANYRINRMRQATGFLEKQFPFNYLGCPIYIGCRKIEYFDGLVTKIVNRLSVYTLATMDPPKATFKLIEKHLQRFFWGSTSEKKTNTIGGLGRICAKPKRKVALGLKDYKRSATPLPPKDGGISEPINPHGLNSCILSTVLIYIQWLGKEHMDSPIVGEK